MDGAEAAYRAVIAADPGDAESHCKLGYLLHTEQRDIESAEAGYRAAIGTRALPVGKGNRRAGYRANGDVCAFGGTLATALGGAAGRINKT